jgi:hypothetical protein
MNIYMMEAPQVALGDSINSCKAWWSFDMFLVWEG